MELIQILIITAVLLAIAMLGLGIKLLLDKKATFPAGCAGSNEVMRNQGISCGCGGGHCMNEESEEEAKKQVTV